MKTKAIWVSLIALIFAIVANAQVRTKTFSKGIPKTFLRAAHLTERKYSIKIPSNLLELKIKAIESDTTGGVDNFAVPISVDINFMKEARLSEKGGISTYFLSLIADSALNLSILFNKFKLSQNALMSIYSEFELTDSITSNENNSNNTWVTRVYQKNKLNIVLKVPSDERNRCLINIGTVLWGYRQYGIFPHFGSPGASASCQVNVACPAGAGWENERNSVALINAYGAWCTGTLVMNTCGTNIPYLLTANHCVVAKPNVQNWVFQFFYFSTDCNTNTGYREDIQFNGSTLVASSSLSDFALLKLFQVPPANSGIHYAGWDRNYNNAAFSPSITMLHHPKGDVLKLSRSSSPQAVSFGYADCWYLQLNLGGREGGSSGGPYFNAQHRIIGQHYGVYTINAGNPCHPDQYGGRFDVSWTGGGTNSTRLSNWLDPNNSGAVTTNTTNVSALFGGYAISSGSGTNSFCNSETYTLSPTPPAGSAISWYVSPGAIVSMTNWNTPQVTVNTLNSGTFNLTATVTTNGCTSTTTVNNISAGVAGWSGDIWTSADQSLILQSWAEPDYNYICQNTTVYFHIDGANSASDYNYFAGSLSGTPYFDGYYMTFYMDPGSYATFAVTVTIGGCTQTLHFTFVAMECPYLYYRTAPGQDSSKPIITIADGKLNSNYIVAPNPVRSELTIYADNEQFRDRKVTELLNQTIQKVLILDMSGKVFKQQDYSPNTRKATLNVSSLPSAIYMARIFDGKKWISIKFMKK